jgi:hypothetical protein
VAAACGYRHSAAFARAGELAQAVGAFRPGDGPLFAHLAIRGGHAEDARRVGVDLPELRDRFRQEVLRAVPLP